MQRGRLLVEGWRGISHSFALVNQHQLLAWAKAPGLQLFHRDLPLYRARWNSTAHSAGFDAADCERLNSLSEPEGEAVDAVYRIAFPTPMPPTGSGETPSFSFIVTNFGLKAGDVAIGAAGLAALTQGRNAVITPSAWSRTRLLDSGLDPARVHVVSHGVSLRTFQPFSTAERAQRRQAMGLAEGHFVFTNVGVASWNKGLDHLIVAFARLQRRHPEARLVLKNHRALYGADVGPLFDAVDQVHPGLLSDDVMDAIFVINDNLDQAGLRELYACSDCYVSPYRAEGFNLPVLEALACATPVVVTAGGATDDFCTGPWASRVPGRLTVAPAHIGPPGAPVIEVDGDGLLHAMQHRLLAASAERRLGGAAWQAFVENLSWERVSGQLLDLMLPAHAGRAAAPANEAVAA